ncbi:hypothetical protein [Nitrolancea hollandica]|nr:hypothetical protein [Nitrolancea hollandica]
MVLPIPGMPPAPPSLPLPVPLPGAAPMPFGPGVAPQQATGTPPTERKKKAPPKPDKDTILKRIERTVAYWKKRDDVMDENELLYFLEDDAEGEGTKIIKNTPRVVVDKATQIVGNQEPSVEIIPPRAVDSKIAQKGTSMLRWTWSEWDRAWGSSLYAGLRPTMAWFGAQRGLIACRIQLLDEPGPDEPPARLIPRDPRQVYPQLNADGLGLRWVINRIPMTIGALKSEWEEAEKLFEGREDDESIDVDAYYDEWWHAVYAEGEEIRPPTAHEYGFVPWAIRAANSVPIRATSRDKTNWVGRSFPAIFEPIKLAYKQLNKVLSQIATEVERSANPPLLYFYDPARPEEPRAIKFDKGETNYLIYDRERVEPLMAGPRPVDAGPLVNALTDDIEKGSLPSVLWGVNANATGFALSLLQGSARDQLYNLARAMERIQEDINHMYLRLIRDFHDSDVGFWVKDEATGDWVSGETLTVDEIAKIGTKTRVKYHDLAPQDRIALANLAAMLVDKKIIDLETARRDFVFLENPERVNDRVLHDLVYLDEQVVKNVLVREALRRTDPELAAIYEQHLAQQQMQPPPGAPPAGPTGLPPGVLAPPMQANPNGPMDLLAQAAASAAGGVGMERPTGIPGAGAPPMAPPLIPGLI